MEPLLRARAWSHPQPCGRRRPLAHYQPGDRMRDQPPCQVPAGRFGELQSKNAPPQHFSGHGTHAPALPATAANPRFALTGPRCRSACMWTTCRATKRTKACGSLGAPCTFPRPWRGRFRPCQPPDYVTCRGRPPYSEANAAVAVPTSAAVATAAVPSPPAGSAHAAPAGVMMAASASGSMTAPQEAGTPMASRVPSRRLLVCVHPWPPSPWTELHAPKAACRCHRQRQTLPPNAGWAPSSCIGSKSSSICSALSGRRSQRRRGRLPLRSPPKRSRALRWHQVPRPRPRPMGAPM
jgi:hypothetical protein